MMVCCETKSANPARRACPLDVLVRPHRRALDIPSVNDRASGRRQCCVRDTSNNDAVKALSPRPGLVRGRCVTIPFFAYLIIYYNAYIRRRLSQC
jgi:hypothetical protein